MVQESAFIEVKNIDKDRPKGRVSKNSWKIKFIKKALLILQYLSKRKTANIIWKHITTPGRTTYSESQKQLLKKATIVDWYYKDKHTQWLSWGAEEGKKKLNVFVLHGWRSKTIDFKKLIQTLLDMNYVVEGLDMPAHGHTKGKQSCLPEFCDILQTFLSERKPYDIIIGYSMGGIALSVTLNKLSPLLHPKQFFVLAAPPDIYFFFEDIIREIGISRSIYHALNELIEKKYLASTKDFDVKCLPKNLTHVDTYLIYCEDDQVIPFQKGLELAQIWTYASFVHVKGFGHYKIISHPLIIDYIVKKSIK